MNRRVKDSFFNLLTFIQMNAIHRIVQWDCLEMMKKIPNNTIDFICSDFPYNISNNNWLTIRWTKIVKADFGEWDKWDNEEDYLKFVFDICKEYKRILKPEGSLVLFFGYKYAWWISLELERRGLFTFRNPIILAKENPLPRVRKNGFRSCHEIWMWLVNNNWNFKKPKTFNFLSQDIMKNVMTYKIWRDGNKQTNHPTEKPEFLIQKIIEVFTNPWDIVLDSFWWWWTTWVAAYKVWRHCISIEKESGFIKMIQDRQKKATIK